MAVGFPSYIVIKNVEDVAFFNGLLHGIKVKGFLMPISIKCTEQLNGFWFRSCRKSDHCDIWLFSTLSDFFKHLIFFGFLFLSILAFFIKSRRFCPSQHICNGLHIRPFRRGVRLIYKDCKTLRL